MQDIVETIWVYPTYKNVRVVTTLDLPDAEILKLADNGNACFGGDVQRMADWDDGRKVYQVKVYTD